MISIQPSFEEVIEDVQNSVVPDESFWINLIQAEQSTEYIVQVDASGMRGEGVNVIQKGSHGFQATIEGQTYNLKGISKTYAKEKKNPTSAVAKCGSCVIYGDTNGDITVVNDQIETTVQAHYADISLVEIFPSKNAIITGSVDMTLKLWSVKDWVCRREFRGHTGVVNQVCLLGATGRNFVSVSDDGSLRLWETGSGKQVYEFRRVVDKYDAACCVAIEESPNNIDEANEPKNVGANFRELDFETKGHLAYVGYRSGAVQQYDLYKRSQTSFKIVNNSPVTAMCLYKGSLLCGFEDGSLRYLKSDTRKQVSDYRIDKLQIVGDKVVALTGGFVVKIGEGFEVEEYYVGIERVNDIALDGAELIVGGKEGVVLYR